MPQGWSIRKLSCFNVNLSGGYGNRPEPMGHATYPQPLVAILKRKNESQMISNRRNFYFKSQINIDEAIEVYVGQNSGKQLNEDLRNAKEEVLIISPYIDESKLDELLRLKNRSVNVRLAFSDLNPNQFKNILKKLIHQNKETNIKQREKREKLKNVFLILSIFFLVVAVLLLSYSVLHLASKEYSILNFGILFMSLLIMNLSFHFWRKKNKAERIEIYRYDYSEKLNFKYLRDYYGERMFIHSKIYLIDKKIAYVGSLNFTNKGFTSNFETRVRITERDKINELREFVHNVFDDDINFKKHELNWLGKKVYTEEKY